MPFNTYDELKTSLTNWCSNRSDVAPNAEDFIRLAEDHLNMELRCRQQVTTIDLTPVDGVLIVPPDFSGVLSVVLKGTPKRTLSFISLGQAQKKYDLLVSGYAQSYTFIGETIQTYPFATSDVELTYHQKIPNLSNDVPGTSDTNWLLRDYPGLYLEASQTEFLRWNQDHEQLILSSQRVMAMIDRINGRDDVDQFADATMTIDGPTP